jgi:hypothetical protein
VGNESAINRTAYEKGINLPKNEKEIIPHRRRGSHGKAIVGKR